MPWINNNFQTPSCRNSFVHRKEVTLYQEKTENLGALHQIIRGTADLSKMLLAVCGHLASCDNLSVHQDIGSKLLSLSDNAGFPDSLQTLADMIAKRIGCGKNPYNLSKIICFLMIQISDLKETDPKKATGQKEKEEIAKGFVDSLLLENQYETWDISIQPENLNFYQKNAYALAKRILAQKDEALPKVEKYFSKVLKNSEEGASLFFACQKYAVALNPQVSPAAGLSSPATPAPYKTPNVILDEIEKIKDGFLSSPKQGEEKRLIAFFGLITLELDPGFKVHRQDPTHCKWVEKAISRKIQDKESYLTCSHFMQPKELQQSYLKLLEKLERIRGNQNKIKDLCVENPIGIKKLFKEQERLKSGFQLEYDRFFELLSPTEKNTDCIGDIRNEMDRWRKLLSKVRQELRESPYGALSHFETFPLDLELIAQRLSSLEMVPKQTDPFETQIQATLQDIRYLKNQDPMCAADLMNDLLLFIGNMKSKITENSSLYLYDILQKEMTDFEFSIRKQKELFFRYDKSISALYPGISHEHKEGMLSFLVSEKELKIAEWYIQEKPKFPWSFTKEAFNFYGKLQQRVLSFYKSRHKKDMKKNSVKMKKNSFKDKNDLWIPSHLSHIYKAIFNENLRSYSKYKIIFLTEPVLKITGDYEELDDLHVDFSALPRHSYFETHVICRGTGGKKGSCEQEARFFPVYFDKDGKPHIGWRKGFDTDELSMEVQNWSPHWDSKKAKYSYIQSSKWEKMINHREKLKKPSLWNSAFFELGWSPLLRPIYERIHQRKTEESEELKKILYTCDQEQKNHLIYQEALNFKSQNQH